MLVRHRLETKDLREAIVQGFQQLHGYTVKDLSVYANASGGNAWAELTIEVPDQAPKPTLTRINKE